MDKRLYAILALLLVGGLGYYAFSPRCEQPDKLTVALIQFECAKAIDVEAFRADLCQKQYGTSVCELTEADRPAAEAILFAKVNDCTTAELVKQNKCIDKYEAIK